MNEIINPDKAPFQTRALKEIKNILESYDFLLKSFNLKTVNLSDELKKLKQTMLRKKAPSTAIATIQSTIPFLKLINIFLGNIKKKISSLCIPYSYEEESILNLILREFYTFIDIFQQPERSFDSIQTQNKLSSEKKSIAWFGIVRSILTHNRTTRDQTQFISFINDGLKNDFFESTTLYKNSQKKDICIENINLNDNLYISKTSIKEFTTIYSDNTPLNITFETRMWITNLNSKQDKIDSEKIKSFDIIWWKESPQKILNLLAEIIRLLNLVLDCLLN